MSLIRLKNVTNKKLAVRELGITFQPLEIREVDEFEIGGQTRDLIEQGLLVNLDPIGQTGEFEFRTGEDVDFVTEDEWTARGGGVSQDPRLPDLSTHQYDVLRVNASENALEFLDMPSLTGNAGKVVTVNATEDGFEFNAVSGGSPYSLDVSPSGGLVGGALRDDVKNTVGLLSVDIQSYRSAAGPSFSHVAASRSIAIGHDIYLPAGGSFDNSIVIGDSGSVGDSVLDFSTSIGIGILNLGINDSNFSQSILIGTSNEVTNSDAYNASIVGQSNTLRGARGNQIVMGVQNFSEYNYGATVIVGLENYCSGNVLYQGILAVGAYNTVYISSNRFGGAIGWNLNASEGRLAIGAYTDGGLVDWDHVVEVHNVLQLTPTYTSPPAVTGGLQNGMMWTDGYNLFVQLNGITRTVQVA